MKEIKNIRKYVFYTYIVFWIMILIIGGLVSMLTSSDYFAMQWMMVICSWSPTIVLFALSKKILKGTTLKQFYKDLLREKVTFSGFLLGTLIIVVIYFSSVLLYSLITSNPFSFNISITFPSVIWNLIFSILQGASGEESGWRGYLLPQLVQNYGFSKGNVILGFIWAFWHLPLWFISSGYSGWMLIQYIVVFIIFAISFTILMGWVQQKCRNLFLAFWMHFLFNFLLTTLTVDLLVPFTIMSIFYVVVAVIIVAVSKKQNVKLK